MIELVLVCFFLVIVVILFALRNVVDKVNRLERWVILLKEEKKTIAVKKAIKRKV